MLCSVVEQLESGDSTEEVGRNTRLRLVFPSSLLLCYRRFLRALQQTRAQSRLLYLLIFISDLVFIHNKHFDIYLERLQYLL